MLSADKDLLLAKLNQDLLGLHLLELLRSRDFGFNVNILSDAVDYNILCVHLVRIFWNSSGRKNYDFHQRSRK